MVSDVRRLPEAQRSALLMREMEGLSYEEISTALETTVPEIKSLLANLNTLVGELDAHKGEITRALDGLNRLGGTLNAQRDQIGTAHDRVG